MISSRHWLLALGIALSLHAAPFLLAEGEPREDAAAEGQLVLSIGGAMDAMGETEAMDVVESDGVETVELVEPVPYAEDIPQSPAPIEAAEVVEAVETPEIPPLPSVEQVAEVASPAVIEQVSDTTAAVVASLPDEQAQATEESAQAELPAAPLPARKPQARAEVPQPARETSPAPRRQAANSSAGNRTSPQAATSSEAGNTGQVAQAVGRAEMESFRGLVHRRIQRSLRYPSSAKRRGISGTPTVRFRIDEGGNLTSIALLKSSGYPELDEAALDAVRRAAPFRADGRPPLDTFTAPIAFDLR